MTRTPTHVLAELLGVPYADKRELLDEFVDALTPSRTPNGKTDSAATGTITATLQAGTLPAPEWDDDAAQTSPNPQPGDRVGPDDVGVGDVVRENYDGRSADTLLSERVNGQWQGVILVDGNWMSAGTENVVNFNLDVTLVARAKSAPQPSPLQLQVGHRYRARDGSEWDVAEFSDEDFTYPFYARGVGHRGSTWFTGGGLLLSHRKSERDLIEDLGPTPSAKPKPEPTHKIDLTTILPDADGWHIVDALIGSPSDSARYRFAVELRDKLTALDIKRVGVEPKPARLTEPSDPAAWTDDQRRDVLNALIEKLDPVWGLDNLVDVNVEEPDDYVVVLAELLEIATSPEYREANADRQATNAKELAEEEHTCSEVMKQAQRARVVNQRRELRRLNALVRFFRSGGQSAHTTQDLQYRLRKSQWKKDRALTLLAKATGVEYSAVAKQVDDAWVGQLGVQPPSAQPLDIDAVLAKAGEVANG